MNLSKEEKQEIINKFGDNGNDSGKLKYRLHY